MAGAGSVAYHGHSATVQIKGPNGQVHNVNIPFGKQQYSCPAGTNDKTEPLLIRMGRIKLTLKSVDAELNRIDKKYPGSHAPRKVVLRYNADIRRGRRLVKAANATTDAYNAILDHDCTRASR